MNFGGLVWTSFATLLLDLPWRKDDTSWCSSLFVELGCCHVLATSALYSGTCCHIDKVCLMLFILYNVAIVIYGNDGCFEVILCETDYCVSCFDFNGTYCEFTFSNVFYLVWLKVRWKNIVEDTF